MLVIIVSVIVARCIKPHGCLINFW